MSKFSKPKPAAQISEAEIERVIQGADAIDDRRSIVSSHKVAAPAAVHQCPSCHQPQTKIKRVLESGKFGSTNFVCSRMECALGIDVSKLETWVVE